MLNFIAKRDLSFELHANLDNNQTKEKNKPNKI